MIKKLFHHNLCFLFLALSLLFLAWMTLHGLAVAHGVGHYFAILKGSPDKRPFDIMVDICGMLSLLFVLVGPFLLLGPRSSASFFRLATLYFAFIPAQNLAFLSHLFSGQEQFTVGFGIDSTLALLTNFPKEILPVTLLTHSLYAQKQFKIQKWHAAALMFAVLLSIGMLFLPTISEIMLYWMSYSLVITTYAWLEKLFASHQERYEKILMWLLIAVFCGRGIYRMLEILEVYPAF